MKIPDFVVNFCKRKAVEADTAQWYPVFNRINVTQYPGYHFSIIEKKEWTEFVEIKTTTRFVTLNGAKHYECFTDKIVWITEANLQFPELSPSSPGKSGDS